jgi:hypothetical protein
VVSTRQALNQNERTLSLQSLAQQEKNTDAQIEKLNTQIATLTTQSGASAVAQLGALEARLTSLQDFAGQILVQENSLEAQLGPQAKVIDRAISATGVHGRQLDNALLGAVLGLVLGIAIAAVSEVIRPSLIGPVAVSRAVGAPLLGEMSTPPGTWTVAALPDAGSYIELAAGAKGVHEVRFAVLDPKRGRRRARVRMLEGPLHRLRFSHSRSRVPVSVDGSPATGLASAAAVTAIPADQDDRSSPGTGLVAAVPRVLKQADVDPLINFIWVSGWVLLGVITYPPPRKAIMASRRGSGSDRSGRDSSVAKQTEVDAW